MIRSVWLLWKRVGSTDSFIKICTVLFNLDVLHEVTISCSNILWMKHVTNFGKYLGFPSVLSRNWNRYFQNLKAKVQKVIVGCKVKKKNPSRGKKILIEAVAQSIPAYTMCSVRLPNKLCFEVSKQWDALCKLKALGGLGFRRLEGFQPSSNRKTSLADEMNRPLSLAVQFFKGRYFH